MLPVDIRTTRHGRVAALLAFSILAAASIFAISPAASAAEGTPTIEVTGHGYGHGWGLGQYGAFGYASDHGWSSVQILDHYYGNTRSGPTPAGATLDVNNLRIDLRSDRGAPTTAAVTNGTINLTAGSDSRPVGSYSGRAVRLRISPTGFYVDVAPDCSGPFETMGEILDETRVQIAVDSTATGKDGLVSYCTSKARQIWYPGTLEAVNFNGEPRTVNVVSLEDYLRGVVPKEVPAVWGDRGGMAALEAQAVAARSYVMSGDGRYTGTFADSCDTTLCQVYGGWYETPTSGNPDGVVFDDRTDVAIVKTVNLVRIRNDNGKIARTFFSSSTGGHTQAIDPFPAVEDLGDSVSANPRHQWTEALDLTNFELAAGLGVVQEIRVIGRNGLDGKWNDGGRVTEVEVTFENGIKKYTGSAFRSAFGLNSDWFSFGPVLRDGVPVASNGRFVDAASEVFLGRAPTAGERAAWVDDLNKGRKSAVLTQLSNSDEWAGTLIDGLYQDVLGRGADGAGRSYWRGEMARGFRFEAVGTYFYGSDEYFRSVGGTNRGFVNSLYTRILKREPEAAGFAYWMDLLDRQKATTIDVARSFYASAESRQQRTRNLFTLILGRQPDDAGLIYWSLRLENITDLQLAVDLALTDEFAVVAANRR